MTKYLLKFSGGGTYQSAYYYTVENGEIVRTPAMSISVQAFIDYGFDSLTGVGSLIKDAGTNTQVLAWSNDGYVATYGALTGVPNPKFIETDPVNLPSQNIVSVSGFEYTITGNPTASFQIDSGTWVCYDGSDWVAGRNPISSLSDIPSTAWEDLFNGATTLRVRVWMDTTADTISSFKMTFVTN